MPTYDYSSPGEYFVTICTQDRQPILANETNRQLAEDAWNWLPERFPNVELDEFVIMPDHVHFIVCLRDVGPGGPPGQGARRRAPTLANIVGAFKTVAARSINEHRGRTGERVWQRNYFERVIRDEDELNRIREYIRYNPLSAHDHQRLDDIEAAWKAKS